MKNKLIKTGVLAALTACMAITSSCQKDDMRIFKNDPSEQPAPSAQKTMFNGRCAAEIRLGDTWTAGMGAINLEITRVAVHYTNVELGLDGWVYLPTHDQTINILQYQEGKSAVLATDNYLPEGIIDQARVEFGDNSNVVWADATGKHAVKLTMTAAEHIATVPANIKTNRITKLGFILDINAVQSIIVLQGGDIVRFHPHMKLARMTHETLNGGPTEIPMADVK